MRAPFPYFGGKSKIASIAWQYLGSPKQYIEPFCGSAAVLLAAQKPASLEVVNDLSCFIANFWRSVKCQSQVVAEWADYPVSHIDLGARHGWLVAQAPMLCEMLQDPNWPGDAKIAGWWLWGQCSWIGSGWCDASQIPHAGNAGMGVQAIGQIPHAGNAGMGVQAIGKIPHAGNAGMGVQAIGKIPHAGNAGRGMLTSGGRTAESWLAKLSDRLERTRIVCGTWDRCLNRHYGGSDTSVFLDPPYDDTEELYGADTKSVTAEVVDWCRGNADAKIVLCGHAGDYDLDWPTVAWERAGLAYGGGLKKGEECLWVSPPCKPAQGSLF